MDIEHEDQGDQVDALNEPVDRKLLLEFFLNFSQFEYALKASGFFKRRDDSLSYPAEPDWDSFAVALREVFNRAATTELTLACDFFAESPPNRQVITNDNLAWETRGRDDSISEIEWLLRMVRVVRNNLFHGGKFNIHPHQTTERTEALLRNSLIILIACLELSPDVRLAYESAVL